MSVVPRITAAIAAVLVACAGCASEEQSAKTVQTAEIGKQIVIRSAGSPLLANLWLDSVVPVDCTEPGSLAPTSGRYLAATIVLQTTQDYQPDWGWWMSPTDFTTENDKGEVTGHGVISSCLPEHRYLPDDFYLSDSGYYGVVLLDASSDHGNLVYRPHNLPIDVAGWKWQF